MDAGVDLESQGGYGPNYSALSNGRLIDESVGYVSSLPGWSDAPKHYCSSSVAIEKHNDPRALAWCCHLSKKCTKLYRKLDDFGISHELYEEAKRAWTEKLEAMKDGAPRLVICFDSIAYCCKKEECRLRDPALSVLKISPKEYYRLKKELGDIFLGLAEQAKGEKTEEST